MRFPNAAFVGTGKGKKEKCRALGSGLAVDRSIDGSLQHRAQQQGGRLPVDCHLEQTPFLGSLRAHCKYLELEGRH